MPDANAPAPLTDLVAADLAALRQRLADTVLGSLAILSLPALAASWLRARYPGGVAALHQSLLAVAVLLLLVAFRQRLKPRLRILVVVGLPLAVGLSEWLHFGLLGGGRFFFAYAVLLATLMVGLRAGLATLLAAVAMVLAMAVAFVTGHLRYDLDFEALAVSPTMWWGAVLAVGSYLALVLVAAAVQVRAVHDLLFASHQRAADLAAATARLQEEIAQRSAAQEELTAAHATAEAEVAARTAELTRTVETLRDEVAERIAAESALAETEALYRTVVENIPGGSATVVDTEMRYRLADGPLLARLGLSFKELLGRRPGEVLGRDETEDAEARFGAALAGVSAFYEHEYRGRQVEFRMVPLRDAEGAVTGALSLALDITDRRQAEARFRAVFDHANDAITLVDMDLNFVDVNPQACAMLGFEREELLAMGPADIHTHEDWKNAPRFLAELREQGPQTERATQIRRDGIRVEVEINASMVTIGGQPMYLSIARDITDRHLAEQQIRAANAALERRGAQLARLAAELTLAEQRERHRLADLLHDHLQQLLSAARLHADLALRPLAGAEPSVTNPLQQVRALLAEAIEATRTLTVDLSPPVLYEIGLQAALAGLAERFGQRHRLSVRLDLDPAAEPADENRRVLLYQSVQELLFNVAKHADASVATVHMAVEGVERRIVIDVADNGCGFDPALAEREAGGFGLFSIRARLEQLGGRMRIRSAPGDGTVVRLIVPAEA
jgi:PAS domain S-box-containing protein